MRYVLDSSVLVKVALPEADSAKAVALLLDFQNLVHELIAPDVLPVEVAHALTMAERRGLLGVGDSVHKLADLFSIKPDLHPYLPLLPRAIELSSRFRIGVYDCLYAALSEQENCELVTADARLVKSLPGFSIRELSMFP